ncbi:MAG TPA: phenylacetate--CoA ligase family protein [Dermatophilaceae bacterium]|nr:phenylacetate--CoA ligase family protein [Dermatophilaceae bacterium]
MRTPVDTRGMPLALRLWKSTPFGIVRRGLLRASALLLTEIYGIYKLHPAMWRWTARHYHPAMERFARLHAWMTCQFAAIDVPAYQDFLRRNDFRFRWWDLTSYPVTDKKSYVQAYPEELRCWDGHLDRVGTVVDESSGSSGTPFNWVRGRRELRTIHKNVAGFTTQIFPNRRLFVINGYSMGAWATGTNTGIAMSMVAMVKNTGPDLDKIVDTIQHFGPHYNYLVTAYPPFLKDLRDRLDEIGFDWAAYRMYGLVGGEGMTEALRDYCEERFVKVRSGYGASDLTIGMAGESDLTVWLRDTIVADPALRAEILGADESRIPMIFQYNPLETYLETTADGELLCTLNSTTVLSPKLRYNIGDEAMLMPFPRLEQIVRPHARLWTQFEQAHAAERMRLPLLFLYGRKDSTVSFMGANIYPQDVEYGLYEGNPRAKEIEGFMLTLEETSSLDSRPVVNIQLREGISLDEAGRAELSEVCQRGIVEHLMDVSRDFVQSVEEDPTATQITVRVHDFETGPFEGGVSKIKKVYLRKPEAG